jgi:hypothetical protein
MIFLKERSQMERRHATAVRQNLARSELGGLHFPFLGLDRRRVTAIAAGFPGRTGIPLRPLRTGKPLRPALIFLGGNAALVA